MMPQFDTFSFFSQLLWVLIGFSYVYLLLCFYILPAFAFTLKVRAKKLNQNSANVNTTNTITNQTDNSQFFDIINQKLAGITFVRTNIVNEVNASFYPIIYKNEAFVNLLHIYKQKFRMITLFI